jgi:hypothetical protein
MREGRRNFLFFVAETIGVSGLTGVAGLMHKCGTNKTNKLFQCSVVGGTHNMHAYYGVSVSATPVSGHVGY